MKKYRFIIAYTIFLLFLFSVGLFIYKIFEHRIQVQLNSVVRDAKYYFALKSSNPPEKTSWLKEWKKVEGSWTKINYLVHIPYLMFHYTPDVRSPYLNTNDLGYRGKENYSHLPSIKPDPRYRYVVLLGGSAAFGAFSSSDEQCISFVLERFLNENNKTDRPFKVINLGMGFYNSFQELLSFILYGMKYNPEFVVTFDGFNDASVSSARHSNKRVPLVSGIITYERGAG